MFPKMQGSNGANPRWRGDSTEAGACGALEPQTLRLTSVARMGFDLSEMAEFMVCGHDIGGVKIAGFLVGVAPGTATSEFGLFDDGVKTQTKFDIGAVRDYVLGDTRNPSDGCWELRAVIDKPVTQR